MAIPNVNKPFSIFPDLPRDHPLVNPDGTMSMYWLMFFDQLVLALQQYYSQEGIVVPQLSAADIALLTTSVSGTVVYDSTNNEFKGNIAGTWKTFTLT